MKRALLVGIDDYDRFPQLGGCVNDVNAVLPLLSRNDDASPNFECQTRVSPSERVDRGVLLDAVQALLAPGADVAVFYFAGHGVEAINDVVLATREGEKRDPGVELSRILGYVQSSTVREVMVILDCCFSGAAGGVPQLGNSLAAIRPGVSLLTASRGDQGAAEANSGRGIFSTYLCGALEGGAADVLGKVTVAGVYAYLSQSFGAWEQRPTFKANVDRLHELRQCRPAVPLESLRRLPEFFRAANAELPLDPSYEPTVDPRDPDHEAAFSILQKCRAAKLVEPIGADHLYFAAMESKACRLTPLGQHYWHMAREGHL